MSNLEPERTIEITKGPDLATERLYRGLLAHIRPPVPGLTEKGVARFVDGSENRKDVHVPLRNSGIIGHTADRTTVIADVFPDPDRIPTYVELLGTRVTACLGALGIEVREVTQNVTPEEISWPPILQDR
jgi:hypothetical protein